MSGAELDRSGTFTRQRVERIIGLVVAVGCLALGGQAFAVALGGGGEAPGWYPALELAVFVPLAAMIVACIVGRGQRVFAGIFAVVYIVGLLVWPVAAAGVPAYAMVEPWMYYLINVGTAAAVLAFPLAWQIAVTAVVPVLWGTVRLVQAGMDPSFFGPVALAVSFALIFGGIVVALVWTFRMVAVGVDDARARAVSAYAAAAMVDATEKERLAVGALMHDSVLAALIAAERAQSPRERMLAVGMAREALTRLADTDRDAGVGPATPVDAADIARRIEEAVGEMGVTLHVHSVTDHDATGHDAVGAGAVTDAEPAEGTDADAHANADAGFGPVEIPGDAARALVLASAQAVANAVEHADGRGLAVSVSATAHSVEGDREHPAAVTVQVRDTGPGFDPHAVAADRLGISASIVARMAAVGGRAWVESDGGGTTVTMTWEAS